MHTLSTSSSGTSCAEVASTTLLIMISSESLASALLCVCTYLNGLQVMGEYFFPREGGDDILYRERERDARARAHVGDDWIETSIAWMCH